MRMLLSISTQYHSIAKISSNPKTRNTSTSLLYLNPYTTHTLTSLPISSKPTIKIHQSTNQSKTSSPSAASKTLLSPNSPSPCKSLTPSWPTSKRPAPTNMTLAGKSSRPTSRSIASDWKEGTRRGHARTRLNI